MNQYNIIVVHTVIIATSKMHILMFSLNIAHFNFFARLWKTTDLSSNCSAFVTILSKESPRANTDSIFYNKKWIEIR